MVGSRLRTLVELSRGAIVNCLFLRFRIFAHVENYEKTNLAHRHC